MINVALDIDFSTSPIHISNGGKLEFHSRRPEKANLIKNSALDKLLGQLGIYATWLSSMAYLQKQLLIFIFHYATFFFCDRTFSYCMKA